MYSISIKNATTFFIFFILFERRLFMKVSDRLLDYVSYWTTFDENNSNIPSGDREFALGKKLEKELKEQKLKLMKLLDL